MVCDNGDDSMEQLSVAACLLAEAGYEQPSPAAAAAAAVMLSD